MTIIIAEAGVNHNGDIDLAKKLIDVAKQAGADFVKFQTFTADTSISKNAKKAEYQITYTDEGLTHYEMVKQLELSMQDFRTLIDYCHRCGIKFLSTAFDIQSLDNLLALKCLDYVKIPSGEITNLPLLRHMAKSALPIIMSTGMADMDEIEAALKVLEYAGTQRDKISILHCTTEYPAPKDEVNLLAMDSIRERFCCDVGYSDHTQGIEVAIAAVARGAKIIEKHFTLDSTLPGPDHAASLEPDEFAKMVTAIRSIESAIGDGYKRPSLSEKKNRLIARKSIVAAKPISKGEIFSADNLAVKRPGSGLSPMEWDTVIGKVAKREYTTDDMIEL